MLSLCCQDTEIAPNRLFLATKALAEISSIFFRLELLRLLEKSDLNYQESRIRFFFSALHDGTCFILFVLDGIVKKLVDFLALWDLQFTKKKTGDNFVHPLASESFLFYLGAQTFFWN